MSAAPAAWFSGLFRFGSSGRDLPSWWAALMGAVSGASYPKVDAERLLTGAGALRRTAVLVDEAGVEIERHATALPTSLPGAGKEMARTLADVGESTRRGAATLREGAGALEEQAGQVDYAQRSMELTAAMTLWTVAQLVWAMATTAGASAALVPGVLAGGRRSVREILAEFLRLVCSGAVFGAGQDALVQASQLGEYRRGLDVTSLLVAGVGGLAGGLGDPAGHALGARMPAPALLRKAVGGAVGGAIGGEAGAVVSTAWQGGEWDPTMFGLAAAAGAGTGVIGGALHHYTQLKHVRNPRLSQDPVGVRGTDHWTAPAAHDRQPAAELPPPALTGTPEPVSHEATAPAPRESGVARPEAGRATVERLGHVEAAVSSTASDARPGGPDPAGAERDLSTTPTRPAPTTTGDHPAHEHAVRTADTPARPLEPLYDRRDWRSHQANWLEAVAKAQKNPLVREVQTIPADRLHTWWNALPELHRRQLNAELNVLVAPADRPAPAARIPEPAAVVRLRAAFAGELATHRLTDPHTTTDQILDRTPGHPTNHPATPDDHSRQTFLHAAGLQATAADRRAGILPGGTRPKESVVTPDADSAAASSATSGPSPVSRSPAPRFKRPASSPSGSDPQPHGELPGKRLRATGPTHSVIGGTPVTTPTDQTVTTALTRLAQELKEREVLALRNGTLEQLARYTLPGKDQAQLRKAARTTLSLRPGEPLTTAGLQLGHTLDRLLTDPAHTTARWRKRASEYADFLDRHGLPLDPDHLDILTSLDTLIPVPKTGAATTARFDRLVTTVSPEVSAPSRVDRLRLITDALALRRENRPVTVDTLGRAANERLVHAMEWTPTTPDHDTTARPDRAPDATGHSTNALNGVGDEAIRFAITLMKKRGDLPFKEGVPEAEDPTVRKIAIYYDVSYKVLARTAAAEAAATTYADEIAGRHTHTAAGAGTPPPLPEAFLPKEPTVRAAYLEFLAVAHKSFPAEVPPNLRTYAATLGPAPADSVFRGWKPKRVGTSFQTHYRKAKAITGNLSVLKSGYRGDFQPKLTAVACLLADNGTPQKTIKAVVGVGSDTLSNLLTHAPSHRPWTDERVDRLVREWIDGHQNSTTLLTYLRASTPYVPVEQSHGTVEHPEFARPVFVRADKLLQAAESRPDPAETARKLGIDRATLDAWVADTVPDLGTDPGAPATTAADHIPFQPRVVLPDDPNVRVLYDELLAVLHEEHPEQVPRQLRAHAAALAPAGRDSVFRGWNPENKTSTFNSHYKTVKRIAADTDLLRSRHDDDYQQKMTAAACLLADRGTQTSVITNQLAIKRGRVPDLVKHAPSQHPWTPEEATRLVQEWIEQRQNGVTLLAHLQANTPYAPVTPSDGRINHPKFAHPVFLHAEALLKPTGASRADIAAELGVHLDTLKNWAAGAAADRNDPATTERPITAEDPATTERPITAEDPVATVGPATDPDPFVPRLILPEDTGVRSAYDELLAVLHQENHSDQIPPRLRDHAATLAPARQDSVFRGWNPENKTSTFNSHYKTATNSATAAPLWRQDGVLSTYGTQAAAVACLLADNGTPAHVTIKHLDSVPANLPALTRHAPSQQPWTPEEATRLVRGWIDHHQNRVTLLAHLQANTPYAPVMHGSTVSHPKFAHPVFLDAYALLRTTTPSPADISRKLGVAQHILRQWLEKESPASHRNAPAARPVGTSPVPRRHAERVAPLGGAPSPSERRADPTTAAVAAVRPAKAPGLHNASAMTGARHPAGVRPSGNTADRSGTPTARRSSPAPEPSPPSGPKRTAAPPLRWTTTAAGLRVPVRPRTTPGVGASTGSGPAAAPHPKTGSVFHATTPAHRATTSGPTPVAGTVHGSSATVDSPGRLTPPRDGVLEVLPITSPTRSGDEEAAFGHGSGPGRTGPFDDADTHLPDVDELFGDEGYGLTPLVLDGEGTLSTGIGADSSTVTHDHGGTPTGSTGVGTSDMTDLFAATSLSDAIDGSPAAPAPPTVVAESPEPPTVRVDTTTDGGTGFAAKVTIPEDGFPLEVPPSPLYYAESPPAHDDFDATSATDDTPARDETMDVDAVRDTAAPSPSVSAGRAPVAGTAPTGLRPDSDPFVPLDDLMSVDIPGDVAVVRTVDELADSGLDRLLRLHDFPEAESREASPYDADLVANGKGFAAGVAVRGITHALDAVRTTDTDMADASFSPYIGTPPFTPGTPPAMSPRAMTLPPIDLPDL
ncbi:hypothetical protein [Kitasatospora sp. NPDC093102]|uniref:hypothetical protein n=1 Tax=Kitasatospora sp. NPDC093102 TaxID=3155069 RepID=UPI00343F4B12